MRKSNSGAGHVPHQKSTSGGDPAGWPFKGELNLVIVEDMEDRRGGWHSWSNRPRVRAVQFGAID
jgi:hypothetical protein